MIEQTGVLEVTQVLSQSAVCKLVSGKAAVNDDGASRAAH